MGKSQLGQTSMMSYDLIVRVFWGGTVGEQKRLEGEMLTFHTGPIQRSAR